MNNKINLDKIPTNINYEGYLWWSDKENPDVYQNQSIITQEEKPIWPTMSTNPFIVEGNLWDRINKISYLIRFIDGTYLVYKFDLLNIDYKEIIEFSYLPYRMPDSIIKLYFKEVWTSKKDPLCNGFDVLQPVFIAFTGFKYKEE